MGRQPFRLYICLAGDAGEDVGLVGLERAPADLPRDYANGAGARPFSSIVVHESELINAKHSQHEA